jgi:hypothetical protein
MATPSENWPKPWMLQLHEQAVEHGFIFVEPISEEDAKSLRDRMYRIRRRSDSSMAAYIRPEYHLVMIGKWEPGAEGAGRLPIIYNKRSDGRELPSVRIADGTEISAYTPKPQLAEPPPPLDDFDPTIKPEEIGDLVSKLRKSARERNS